MGLETEVLTWPPGVSFERMRVPPAAPLYISPNEVIVVDSWGAVSGLTLLIMGRFMLPDGSMTTISYSHVPNTDRSIKTEAFPLGEGFLYALRVDPQIAGARRGQCYVRVSISRSTFTSDAIMAHLISDYVTDTFMPSWPSGILQDSLAGAGILRSVLGTNPAAGAEISETVPTNARWALRGLAAQLVTDATAGTRTVTLTIDDGATVLLQVISGTTQAVSLTRNYRFVPNYPSVGNTVGTFIALPLPDPLYLLQGWRIITVTNALSAGDNWGAPQMLVEEWLEE